MGIKRPTVPILQPLVASLCFPPGIRWKHRLRHVGLRLGLDDPRLFARASDAGLVRLWRSRLSMRVEMQCKLEGGDKTKGEGRYSGVKRECDRRPGIAYAMLKGARMERR